MAAKKFKKHMMYKGGQSKMANTYKEHLDLKKKGYVHTKPKKQLAAYGMKMKDKFLKGGQVKLDMNKDGKLSGEDFKMMSKKKAAYGMKMKKSFMGGGIMKSRYTTKFGHGGKHDRKQYD